MVSVFSRLMRISDRPNRPMASAANDKPPVRLGLPKVKRGTAVRLSSPVGPSRRPSVIMVAVLTREPADTTAITPGAKTIGTTPTEGPTAVIRFATGAARTTIRADDHVR